jgi:hypothetical protein
LVSCGPQFNIKTSILLAAVTGVLASSLQAINKNAVAKQTIMLTIFTVKFHFRLHIFNQFRNHYLIVGCFSMGAWSFVFEESTSKRRGLHNIGGGSGRLLQLH